MNCRRNRARLEEKPIMPAPISTHRKRFFHAILCLLLGMVVSAHAGDNLVPDPSFEQPMPKDRFGHVFARWSGWIYEGTCEFRVSDLAHTGKHSLLMVGRNNPKIRAWPNKLILQPGRYRVTAYLRGLDIGTGKWGQTTEFMFGGTYYNLKKNGTFGWSKLTFVGEVKEKRDLTHPSFGLMAPGYLWVDDVRVEKVGKDVPLTPQPTMAAQENVIRPPEAIGDKAIRCPECGYRNSLSWDRCYACGAALKAKKASAGPDVKLITSFEESNPFSGGKVVAEHATNGKKSLRIDRGYVSMDAAQDWSGYDYLKVDVYTDAKKPLELYVEVRDKQTRDYWTRVNYTTVIPPGASTLIIPTALYVGEKARPGRALMLEAITRLVFSVGDKPEAPLFIDNVRLERDTSTAKVLFDGLWAFDVGPPGSPVMEGFTALDESKTYSIGRGYGWKNVRIWRGFDALQPDPLYRDFLCIEQGGLAIDVPNGKYHVFVNMDSPSGFWGEVQRYRKRALILEGERHEDKMDLESFKKWYFRHWDSDDLPGESTFDKHQLTYFKEHYHEVEVRDGQLNIDFEGENWACSVSAIVVFPAGKAEQGKRFLDFVKARRRFHFDNSFKRVLPAPTGDEPRATAAEKARGFIAFSRDYMRDANVTDRPLPGEQVRELTGSAFAGEHGPVTVSVLPLRDCGKVTASVTDLVGPGKSVLPAKSIDVGYVQHRITRVTAEGSVYTISPRSIMPRASAPVPAGVTRTFWLTVKVPATAKEGQYKGSVKLTPAKGEALSLPLTFLVRKGTLDAVDVPAGPWGHTIDLPWYEEESRSWNRRMALASLKKLREYGFTTASGLPVLSYRGFKDGVPQIDFRAGDEQMKLFKEAGFRMPVITYCPFHGLNLYYRDEAAMKAAGFTDYSAFIKSIFSAVQKHAEKEGWLPVYWNIGDEPAGDDVIRSAINAEAYRKAFPKGPPFFAAASSFTGSNHKDPHFRLSKALHVANWNLHDSAGVKLQHESGSDWAFYNGGNRWTYGVYMYKAAKEYGMKFRLSWHWNASAGDPYYALDCREDDYAWCSAGPNGELLPAVHFERLREGLGDYRRLLTLARLVKEKPDSAAGRAGKKLLADVLGGFELGDREIKGVESFARLRRLDEAIERLR
jgi:hypothetical protein